MGEGDQLFARFGRAFDAGDVLFREDEPGNTMFVVVWLPTPASDLSHTPAGSADGR